MQIPYWIHTSVKIYCSPVVLMLLINPNLFYTAIKTTGVHMASDELVANHRAYKLCYCCWHFLPTQRKLPSTIIANHTSFLRVAMPSTAPGAITNRATGKNYRERDPTGKEPETGNRNGNLRNQVKVKYLFVISHYCTCS